MMQSIGGHELARFHEAKGVKDISCNRCGVSTWEIQSTSDKPASSIAEYSQSGELLTPGTMTLVLVCQHCANLWMMAYEPIAKWVMENPT